jgi:hypothetical protein
MINALTGFAGQLVIGIPLGTPLQSMATERKSGAMASHQGQLGRLAVCAYLAALATALAGCSASEVVQNLTPATAIDLPQPNYRRVVADNALGR